MRASALTFCVIVTLAGGLPSCSDSKDGLPDQIIIEVTADKAKLPARISAYEKAILEKNIDAMVEMVFPPGMIKVIAKKKRATPEKVLEATKLELSAAMASVDFTKLDMDFKAIKWATLSSGWEYGLMPSRFEMTGSSLETVHVENETLVLPQNGQWYFVRVSDASSRNILFQGYPEFKKVKFPDGTIKIVE